MPLAIAFAHGGEGLWLVAVAAAFVFAVRGARAGRVALNRILHPRRRPILLAGNRPGATAWRLGLALTGLVLVTFAAMGPTHGSSLLPVQRKGIDIVACLDTSRSMLAQDMGENRLVEAKKELRSLMQALKGDRMALVAFSGDVRQVAPLTRDTQTLEWFLEGLGPQDNRLGGTDLGGAIDKALALFEDRSGAHEAILLVTDGEDLEGHGLEAAKRAAERNIRIYVLGMGTEGGAKVPGLSGGWVKDEEGGDVVSKLSARTLQDLAEETGGMYIQAQGSVLPLEQLYLRGFSRLEGAGRDGFQKRCRRTGISGRC
ncbi:MAG: VWA domain-containing protein [Planctomycetota bacterium]